MATDGICRLLAVYRYLELPTITAMLYKNQSYRIILYWDYFASQISKNTMKEAWCQFQTGSITQTSHYRIRQWETKEYSTSWALLSLTCQTLVVGSKHISFDNFIIQLLSAVAFMLFFSNDTSISMLQKLLTHCQHYFEFVEVTLHYN